MAWYRWVFHDQLTGENWTVPLNPNAMTNPYPQRKYTYATTSAGHQGAIITNEAHPDPTQWQFSGDILDRAHFDKLLEWSRKRNRISITDHYRRIFVGTMDQFAPIPKRAYGKYWRHTYTVTFTIYQYRDAPAGI